MNEKEKIMQYLDYKGITKNAFTNSLGFAQGFLNQGKSLGADKVKIIISKYPDLSLRWLILDEGPMILEEGEPKESTTQMDKIIDIISSQQNTISSQHEMIRDLQRELSKKDAQREDPAGCVGAAGA